ncbi:hypothetical protein [Empedobacter sp. UBA4754]|uniref:hypothetical protein n=1 Tax=Empedobacter sp. UBA4754 TaxID=1946437 RepID=UPI0025C06061|nr:hypothetical protein [Empedobacter sp. UBA4754]
MDINNTYSGTLDDGEYPKIIYKYRNWLSSFQKNFILNREVYLSSPIKFTDEFDCKIPIRHDLMNNEQLLEYALHWSKIANPNFSRQQYRKDSRNFLKKKIFQSKEYM